MKQVRRSRGSGWAGSSLEMGPRPPRPRGLGHRPARAGNRPAALSVTSPARRASPFEHHAAPEKKFIVESMSGGVALLDFDNDGLLDIYLTDSLTVETARDPKAARSALYRNLGNGKFQDVTERGGVGHPGWAMGACTADVDADGWEDIYVTGLGRNFLYRNNHDGTFTDIAERAGLTGGAGRRAAASPTTTGTGTSTSSSAATCISTSPSSPSSARARPASIAASRCSAAPAASPASRISCSETRQRPLHRGRREGRCPRPPRVLRHGHRLVRFQRGRLAGPVRGQRLRPELPVPEPEGRHVQGGRLPHGSGGERGRRRAGEHGGRPGRLRQQSAA